MSMSNATRKQAREWLLRVSDVNRQLQGLRQTQASLTAQMASPASRLNFRERCLWGWFGGDKNKLTEHKRLRAEWDAVESRLEVGQQERNRLEKQINQLIDADLSQYDPTYQLVVQKCREASAAMNAARYALLLIIEATKAQDSAPNDSGSVEAKPADVPGWLAEYPGQPAREQLYSYLPIYRATVRKFALVEREARPAVEIGEYLAELNLPQIAHAYTLRNIITANQLDTVESELGGLRGAVTIVLGQIQSTLKLLEECRGLLLAQARESLKLPG